MDVITIEYSGSMFWEWWVACHHPRHGLVAWQLDASDEVAAQVEAPKSAQAQGLIPVALVHVGHTAYNMVGPGHINNVANRVIETVSDRLSIGYSDDPDQPLQPTRWIGED